MTSLRRAGRAALYSGRMTGDRRWCNGHAAMVGLRGICPGPAFDLGLAERSVTVQAAYAFGDWPPAEPPYGIPAMDLDTVLAPPAALNARGDR